MRLFVRALFVLASMVPVACSAAGDEPYQLGTHYKMVNDPSPSSGKRIEVDEFFWYGCGHCFAFEPEIEKWVESKPADVDFVPVPNTLGRPIGMLHSKTYYTAEALGVTAKTHRAFFEAIHTAQQPMDKVEDIAAFFNKTTGVLPDVFVSTFNGFAVDSRSRQAELLAKQYGIASTPTVVVGGRYMVNPAMTKGFPDMIKIMNFLVDKVRAERKKK